ncbi:uncharacterized protein LOC110263173 [Arachis ipaensis]|uniref:uncharacterized protein LOC110263173 n=1 Tax=Arachis ipaensis TaxID=130454 RepID=UPI000A2B5761|nr:uncharacterized protein LOC110263173 [Arachis ipaensis]
MAIRQQRTAAQQLPKRDDGKPSHSTTTATPRHSNGGGKHEFDDRDPTKLAAMGFLHTCEHDGSDGVDGLPLDAALCLGSGERDNDDDQTAAAWLWRQRRGPFQRRLLWISLSSVQLSLSLSLGSHSLSPLFPDQLPPFLSSLSFLFCS